jgi:hypothetical protein
MGIIIFCVFQYIMKLLIIIPIFLFLSCDNQEKNYTCEDLKIMDREINERVMWHKHDSNVVSVYNHVIVLKNYNDDCFFFYNFIHFADKYLDTVSEKPVDEITFCKPFDIKNTEYDSIYKYSIITIHYNEDSFFNKIPEIYSITFWANNHRYDIIDLPVNKRQ